MSEPVGLDQAPGNTELIQTTLFDVSCFAHSAEGTKSPLRYPGGKQKAAKQIAQMFPPPADEYREPMVGGASIYFFARGKNFASSYWINDMFAELVAFWQTVQDKESCSRLVAELQTLQSSFSSAEEIKDFYLKAKGEALTDRYRTALLFFFFNRVTFSGTTRAGGFSSAAALKRFTASSIERLRRLPAALSGTRITGFDFDQVLEAPGQNVFLFLDPPYYTARRLYGHNGGLHDFDHERLARTLKKTSHRFLITYDDCPEIRSLYKWAKISEWQLQYGMNNCNLRRESKIGSELFVFNC